MAKELSNYIVTYFTDLLTGQGSKEVEKGIGNK
jgi:hypothetical protein